MQTPASLVTERHLLMYDSSASNRSPELTSILMKNVNVFPTHTHTHSGQTNSQMTELWGQWRLASEPDPFYWLRGKYAQTLKGISAHVRDVTLHLTKDCSLDWDIFIVVFFILL